MQKKTIKKAKMEQKKKVLGVSAGTTSPKTLLFR